MKEKTWPRICRMCGKKFISIYATRQRFCSHRCGQRYRNRLRQYQAWEDSVRGRSEKELLQFRDEFDAWIAEKHPELREEVIRET